MDDIETFIGSLKKTRDGRLTAQSMDRAIERMRRLRIALANERDFGEPAPAGAREERERLYRLVFR